MQRKDDIALSKDIAFKRLRNRVRLEASIRADVILNEMLPEFEEEFDRRVASGQAFELESYEGWVVERVNTKIALPAGNVPA